MFSRLYSQYKLHNPFKELLTMYNGTIVATDPITADANLRRSLLQGWLIHDS